MSQIYRVKDDGVTVLAERVRAFKEAEHLQILIEKNLDLLPGEDIDPEDPRRWLLVKSEMPVPSPESGVNQWSLDLLVGDQLAIPTLIECKLAKNAEAHREILGQLFEYAANGSHYWTAAQLHRLAEGANGGTTSLQERFERLHTNFASTEAYFEAMVSNLREGRLRLIFVLDEIPMRLRSTIKFLTGKMPGVQILALELRQFLAEGQRLVIPYLVGPTDMELMEAAVTNAKARSLQNWNEESFMADVAAHHPEYESAILKLIKTFQDHGLPVNYGNGKVATVKLSLPGTKLRNFLSLSSDGKLWLNFWVLSKGQDYKGPEWRLLESIAHDDITTKNLPADLRDRGPSVTFDDWAPAVDQIASRIVRFLNDSPSLSS